MKTGKHSQTNRISFWPLIYITMMHICHMKSRR